MNKKAQGLSINVIIIVAIALIVLVVLIAIFTGRLGGFVGGIEGAARCDSSCSAIGKDGITIHNKDVCTGTTVKGTTLPGTYSDVTVEGAVCCCT